MNQKQEDDVTMLSAVKKVMANVTYSSIWAGNPVFVSAVGTHTNNLNTINLTAVNQDPNVQGATDAKEQLKEMLIDNAIALAKAGKAYAAANNNANLKAACSITKSDLIHTSEAGLASVCQTLFNAVNPSIGSMAGYGPTTATQTTLQGNITAFGALVGTPRAVQATGVAATTLIEGQVTDAITFVEEQLDGLMEQYRVSQPAFYEAYYAARKRVHHGHRTRVVAEGVITLSGVAVADAIVTCEDGTHKHHKKTDANGKYHFLLHPPVNSVVKVELSGHPTQTKPVVSNTATTVIIDFNFGTGGGTTPSGGGTITGGTTPPATS